MQIRSFPQAQSSRNFWKCTVRLFEGFAQFTPGTGPINRIFSGDLIGSVDSSPAISRRRQPSDLAVSDRPQRRNYVFDEEALESEP